MQLGRFGRQTPRTDWKRIKLKSTANKQAEETKAPRETAQKFSFGPVADCRLPSGAGEQENNLFRLFRLVRLVSGYSANAVQMRASIEQGVCQSERERARERVCVCVLVSLSCKSADRDVMGLILTCGVLFLV